MSDTKFPIFPVNQFVTLVIPISIMESVTLSVLQIWNAESSLFHVPYTQLVTK